MLAPGTRRDIYDQKLTLQPVDNSTISLQMGTNKVASQKGMSVYGLGRQVYDPKYCAAPTEPVIHNGRQDKNYSRLAWFSLNKNNGLNTELLCESNNQCLGHHTGNLWDSHLGTRHDIHQGILPDNHYH